MKTFCGFLSVAIATIVVQPQTNINLERFIPAKSYVGNEQKTLGDSNGNAAIYYLFAICIFDKLPDPIKMVSPNDSNSCLLDNWDLLPYDELPTAECQAFVDVYRRPLHYVEIGSRQPTCDWEGTRDPLNDSPELEGLHRLAKILNLRAKLNIHKRDFPSALQDLATCIALARHLGNSGGLQNSFKAAGILSSVFVRLDEFIDAGGPNLNEWLARLPLPHWQLHTSFQFEAKLFYDVFPILTELHAVSGDGRIGRRVEEHVGMFFKDFEFADSDRKKLLRDLAIKARLGEKSAKNVEHLQLDLESGQMHAFEQLLAERLRLYDDAVELAVSMPNTNWKEENQSFQTKIDLVVKRSIELDLVLTGGLLLQLTSVNEHPLGYWPRLWKQQLSFTRRLCRLRALDLVRQYYLENGRLPITSEVLPPMPLDPLSGQPIKIETSESEVVLVMESIDGDTERIFWKPK